MTLFDSVGSSVLLASQMFVILTVTLACGAVAKRLRQPRVVGEIAGGLLLGPLALGYLFPVGFQYLFAATKLHWLDMVSDAGLVLFLFRMGTEVDLDALRRHRGAAVLIAAGSVGAPFALGCGLGWSMFESWGRVTTDRMSFVLFLGIAMSIAAMPVLARILADRAEAGSPVDGTVGSMAMVCAAANDLLGWCLLAVTLAVHHRQPGNVVDGASLLRLSMAPVYLMVMVFEMRPLAQWMLRRQKVWVWLPGLIALAFGSAKATEWLGVYAFVGAFAAGVCAAGALRDDIKAEATLRSYLRPVVWIALPVFFAMTGLRMKREIFSKAGLGWLGLILLLAVVGKIGGGTAGARAGGFSWRAAVQIGVLLNTRGLVELIVLNVGFQQGILSSGLYTLLVMMAVLTTAMTSALFDLTSRLEATT